MRKTLLIAVFAAAIALSPSVYAQSGTVGTNVGSSMNQPMVVSTDNGNVRMEPNAWSQILTTVPKGQQVTMIGTANGGARAHVKVGNLDGYMDLVQLQKPAQQALRSNIENCLALRLPIWRAPLWPVSIPTSRPGLALHPSPRWGPMSTAAC
jgi:hypothetical protein